MIPPLFQVESQTKDEVDEIWIAFSWKICDSWSRMEFQDINAEVVELYLQHIPFSSYFKLDFYGHDEFVKDIPEVTEFRIYLGQMEPLLIKTGSNNRRLFFFLFSNLIP